jgi:hypothetical protein
LTIFAVAIEATLARQWGCQSAWPTRIGGHHSFQIGSAHDAWGRTLLLQERNCALTARTSARRRTSDLRGGAAVADDDEEEEEEEEEDEEDAGGESEADGEEEGDQSEYDDESDDEETAASEAEVEEEEVAVAKKKPKRAKADRAAAAALSVSYDEPLVASPFLNLYVSIGVMFLAKKVDLFSPTMVRIARYVLSLFSLARCKAHKAHDSL